MIQSNPSYSTRNKCRHSKEKKKTRLKQEQTQSCKLQTFQPHMQHLGLKEESYEIQWPLSFLNLQF